MPKPSKMRLLRDRLYNVESEIAKLKGLLPELETERGKLLIAEEVLKSLGGESEDEAETEQSILALPEAVNKPQLTHRELILKELESGVALSKADMVICLRDRGYEINPNSIGSMLSVLRATQVLE